jgi:N-formylglutamate deformylase
LLLSVPHGGLRIPEEVSELCRLSPEDVVDDSDGGAAAVYRLKDHVAAFIAADVARAIIDLNRAEDDRRKDGVVKTHTCYDVPVYRRSLSDELGERLIARYYRPYHRRLTELAREPHVRLGIDCHTMAAVGPPVGPDPGAVRPAACLSNGDGTCPTDWLEKLAVHLRAALPGEEVRLNDPFRGGHIVRVHARELPWLQLELSRGPFASDEAKRGAVLEAMTHFCAEVFHAG